MTSPKVYGGPGSILVTKSFRLSFDEWVASKGFAVVTVDGRFVMLLNSFLLSSHTHTEAREDGVMVGAD